MPHRSLSQSSFFDPQFIRPACLQLGTVPWLLARCRHELFPQWLTEGWRGEGRLGRDSWPAVVLLTLLLLRWAGAGMSRLESLRRAANDLEWRAAMGLACDVEPPSERTVRDFEAFMRARHPRTGARRYLLLHEHIVRLALQEGVGRKDPLWATDSTPMWCYGDVLDTVRLLGDGLRQVGGRWAKATRTPLHEVSEQWNLPLLLAKSTKGSFGLDWREADTRATVVAELAVQVVRTVEWVHAHLQEARSNLRKGLLHRCASLMRVVRDDLETDQQGRLVIAEKVARDRLISLTDPQARHGRKSAKSLFNGFKLHLLGDLVSGLILSVTVTRGSEHDGTPAHRLIRRAKTLVQELEQVLGDTAYGGSQMRAEIRDQLGVKLLTPPVSDNGKSTRASFAINFAAGTVTCPNGVETSDYNDVHHPEYGAPTRRYKWPKEACASCPVLGGCHPGVRTGHRLLLHPFEKELREHRSEWQDPKIRELYRRRGEFERLNHEAVRHGARRARSWGLDTANFQAHAIVIVCNLRLLAVAMAKREARSMQVDQAAA
jgi:hypothetical protein